MVRVRSLNLPHFDVADLVIVQHFGSCRFKDFYSCKFFVRIALNKTAKPLISFSGHLQTWVAFSSLYLLFLPKDIPRLRCLYRQIRIISKLNSWQRLIIVLKLCKPEIWLWLLLRLLWFSVLQQLLDKVEVFEDLFRVIALIRRVVRGPMVLGKLIVWWCVWWWGVWRGFGLEERLQFWLVVKDLLVGPCRVWWLRHVWLILLPLKYGSCHRRGLWLLRHIGITGETLLLVSAIWVTTADASVQIKTPIKPISRDILSRYNHRVLRVAFKLNIPITNPFLDSINPRCLILPIFCQIISLSLLFVLDQLVRVWRSVQINTWGSQKVIALLEDSCIFFLKRFALVHESVDNKYLN